MSSGRRLGLVLGVATLVLVLTAGILRVAWSHFDHADGHGGQRGGATQDSRGLPGPLNPEEMLAHLRGLRHTAADPVPQFDAARFGDLTRGGRGNCTSEERVVAAFMGVRVAASCTLEGTLRDPYTGLEVKVPGQVAVDRVVSLADAWRSGAWAMDDEQRNMLLNDPHNLVATSKDSHGRKGELAADRWQPVNLAYRCSYALRTIYIKWAYQLTVTDQEARALIALAERCPPPRPPERER